MWEGIGVRKSVKTNEVLVIVMAILAAGSLAAPVAWGDMFTHPLAWDTYDYGESAECAADPNCSHAAGYIGAVFDGRYVYFAPGSDGSVNHGEVLRYDSQGTFTDPAYWSTYDYGGSAECAADPNCTDPDGYRGGAFDGRYIYFAPYYNGSAYHAEVLRYDTTQDFDSPASWATFDASAVPNAGNGYHGALYVDGYVFFIPGRDGPAGYHGKVLRYDTSCDFATASCWTVFDAVAQIGAGGGYQGGAFDGQYIYFAPWIDRTDNLHGEVLRYDTTGDFSAPSSWQKYDYGDDPDGCSQQADPPCVDPDGYHGAWFHEGYVYFAPQRKEHGASGESHGEVLRYDTLGDFTSAGAWRTFDATAAAPPGARGGYGGIVGDGNYIYFAPYHEDNGWHGEVLRYDLSEGFTESSSWSVYEYATDPEGCDADPDCTNPIGLQGVVSDGRYLYFSPTNRDVSDHHGEVLRYDTRVEESVPAVSEWGLVIMTLLALTGGTVLYTRRRAWRVTG